MYSGKLNSWVQFPAVHWTGDDLRWFGNETGGHRRFFTIRAESPEPANQCKIYQWMKTGDKLWWLSQVLDCQEPVTVVAEPIVTARRSSNAQQNIEVNDQFNSFAADFLAPSAGFLGVKIWKQAVSLTFCIIRWLSSPTALRASCRL